MTSSRFFRFNSVLFPSPPADVQQAQRRAIDDRYVVPLRIDPQELAQYQFDRSFEEVAEQLESLPRMYFEPDGSFVWVIESENNRFQLDGSLYDDGDRLLHVELKGICNAEVLDRFLVTLGWPRQSIVVQLVPDQIIVSENEFRRFIGADAASD